MPPRVARAGARSHVPSPVATHYRVNRNNRAVLARLFQKDTLQQLHKLGLPTRLDIAHQLDGVAIRIEYAYATINTQGSFAAGEGKEDIANTFKESMGLPHTAR